MLTVYKNKLNFLNKIKLLTITDILLDNMQIYCSYNVSFAPRVHHLPTIDNRKLPKEIITSFAFKYFPSQEQEFINACDAYNKVHMTLQNPEYSLFKISTGKEIMISVQNPVNKNTILEFKIDDVSRFTGLCRRYKSPTEVEKLLTRIFNRDN